MWSQADLLVHLVEHQRSSHSLIEWVWKGALSRTRRECHASTRPARPLATVARSRTSFAHQRRGFLFAADVATGNQLPIVAAPATPTQTPVVLLPPDKPSIAVLAFQNLSGDPAQDYFADGVVEDIITGLARIKWLLVIAAIQLHHRGHPVDLKRVGRELGVRYVLEGSVRKLATVRINALLVNAETGVHLWADRPTVGLRTSSRSRTRSPQRRRAIEPNLRDAEIERVRRKRRTASMPTTWCCAPSPRLRRDA